MNAELEVLDDLVKHARKLALARDPNKRIVASQWEIFFTNKLEEAQREAAKQAELFEAVNAADDEEIALPIAASQQPRTAS